MSVRKLRSFVATPTRDSSSVRRAAITPANASTLPVDASTLATLTDAFLAVARAEHALSVAKRRRKWVAAARRRGEEVDAATAAACSDAAIAARRTEVSKAKAHRRGATYQARKAGGAGAIALVANIFSGRTASTLGRISDPEAAFAAAVDFVAIAISRPGALDPAARAGLLRGCLLGVGADALAIKVAGGRASQDEIKLALALSSGSRLDLLAALQTAATAPKEDALPSRWAERWRAIQEQEHAARDAEQDEAEASASDVLTDEQKGRTP